ncbi:MAG: hypothetical protein AABY68_05285 [Pseudomonadota bacterium]
MAPDAVDDAEWQRMLAEFKAHFWLKRAPAFAQAWAASAATAPECWGDDLKLSLHGLAGVAALVEQAALGDLARAIEQQWDSQGPSRALLPELQRLAAELSAEAQRYTVS